MTPTTRRCLAAALRWVAALATLAAVVLLFRAPLAHTLLPGLDRTLSVSGVDAALHLGPAPGFQLRAASEPPGGELFADGEALGTLPLLGNVVCRNGQEVELEVRLAGHAPWRRTVECREFGTLEITARLERR